VERRLADEHLVEEHAKAPKVDRLKIIFVCLFSWFKCAKNFFKFLFKLK
jgi:hypothetical protein